MKLAQWRYTLVRPPARMSRGLLSPLWLPLSLLAIAASASHVIIDLLIGVYPREGAGFAAVISAQAAIYATWGYALLRSAAGVRSAFRAAGYLALIQGTFLNGVPIVVCPPVVFLGLPPVWPLSPWQDFAHIGSLVFGTLAFLALRAHRWPASGSRLPKRIEEER